MAPQLCTSEVNIGAGGTFSRHTQQAEGDVPACLPPQVPTNHVVPPHLEAAIHHQGRKESGYYPQGRQENVEGNKSCLNRQLALEGGRYYRYG